MRGRGKEGLLLLLPGPLRLLCLQKPPRSRWWKLSQQKRLWLWSKSPSRNAGRPRVRPRHAAAQSRNHYEENAPVPRHRFSYSGSNYAFLLFFFLPFTLFLFSPLCKFSVCNPHLYHGHNVFQSFVRVALSVCLSDSPYSSPFTGIVWYLLLRMDGSLYRHTGLLAILPPQLRLTVMSALFLHQRFSVLIRLFRSIAHGRWECMQLAINMSQSSRAFM